MLVEPDPPEGIASLLAAGRSASHFGELEGGAYFAYWRRGARAREWPVARRRPHGRVDHVTGRGCRGRPSNVTLQLTGGLWRRASPAFCGGPPAAELKRWAAIKHSLFKG